MRKDKQVTYLFYYIVGDKTTAQVIRSLEILVIHLQLQMNQ